MIQFNYIYIPYHRNNSPLITDCLSNDKRWLEIEMRFFIMHGWQTLKIEYIQKFYSHKPRIMRNSQLKPNRNTIANPFQYSNYYSKVTSPKANDLRSSRAFLTRHGTFESNYNYFIKKIGQQKVVRDEEANNPQKKTHQRYNSMGNSRIMIQSGKSSQYTNSKINHCQSSPYLLQHPNIANPHDEKSKMFQIDSRMSAASPNTLSKHTMKYSMKNAHPKQPPQQKAFLQQSIMSTAHQTSNNSIASKSAQDQLAKQELHKYFLAIHERLATNLKTQIDQQTQTILKMQTLIKNLAIQLFSKQQKLNELTIILRNNKNYNKVQLNPQNQLTQKSCIKKIKQIQQYLNSNLKLLMREQSQTQIKLNQKIDKVIKDIINMPYLQNKIHNCSIKNDLIKFEQNMKKYSQILYRNNASMSLLEDIKKVSENIKQKCLWCKDWLGKSLGSRTILEQTAQFKVDESWNRKDSFGQQMNSSMSYFFHPTEFANLQKITQLFVNRQGQPIKCYTDKLNQVKYKDTNTYMFNKRGDVVQLTSKEKQYYIDKGFIISDK